LTNFSPAVAPKKGSKIGEIVGVVVGAIVLGLVLVGLFLWRYKSRKVTSEQQGK
jgi:hypothetical protein